MTIVRYLEQRITSRRPILEHQVEYLLIDTSLDAILKTNCARAS